MTSSNRANAWTAPRVALVTGAGRRVGKAIALGLAEEGYNIVVHYNISAEGAEETAAAIVAQGGKAVILQHDLARSETSGVLIEKACGAVGQVSVLVNSAALFDEDQLESLSVESWSKSINVNLASPVFLMQAFARQEPIPQDAAIVNILDTQMTSASPERFSYFCGKFGLDGATRLAAFDLAAKGITVNGVAPGLVLPSGQTVTEYKSRQQMTPLGEGLGPQDVVDAVRYLIRARQVTGHVLVVDAGQRLMGFGNARMG